MSKDTPLKVTVEGDELVIRCGIDVVAWAFDHCDFNNPFHEDKNDWIQQWKVSDTKEFAQDVALAMRDEEEDGSTPLIRFLDEMCQAAADDGSQGIDEVE